jgi:TetR/AcrR family transcriptional regulator, mexJK operon transcriptional repressor
MTSETPARRPRRDSIRKRLAVMEAARKLFLRKGYSASSMDEVSELAKVSKRTVYGHYGSKEKLFFEMIKEMCAEVLPERLAAVGAADSANVEARLIEIGTVFLTNIYTSDQIKLFREVMSEARVTPEVGRMMLEGPVEGSHRVIASYLAEMSRQGHLKLSDPDMAASQFQGLLKTDIHMRLLLGQKLDTTPARLREVASSCVRLFLHGYAGN